MPNKRDKHLVLDQELLDRARQVLGVKTERQAVEEALALVASEEALDRLLQKLGGKGQLQKVFQ